MSRLVNASGRENQDVDAAGILSNAGRYAVLLTSAGRPRSDSPRGLFFIGESERLYAYLDSRPFSFTAYAFCSKPG
jgi:hypothetical protein